MQVAASLEQVARVLVRRMRSRNDNIDIKWTMHLQITLVIFIRENELMRSITSTGIIF
jgi:hypothetical protein